MAFGTGGHVTTRQCLESSQRVPPGSLLDLGTGSGVVAFAALRLGFAPVCGLDIRRRARARRPSGNARLNGARPRPPASATRRPGGRAAGGRRGGREHRAQPILALGGACTPWPREQSEARGRRDILLAGLLVEQATRRVAAFRGYELVGVGTSEAGWALLRLRMSRAGEAEGA